MSRPTPEFDPPGFDHLDTDPHRDAFRVADALAVHGSTCVCPRCAARLPGLLRELARALDAESAPAR